MPRTEADVLPTQFGNAISAFETYAYDVYGADSVMIWPRLLAVASKEYASAVQEARTQVDFHIGCCVLAFLLALLALLLTLQQIPFGIVIREVGYAWEISHHNPALGGASGRGLFNTWTPILELLPFAKLLWLISSGVASRIFYCWAVAAVPAWGNLVMSGFDCYLPKLAEQLGFTLPRNDARRREFWQQFSEMITYRSLPGEPPVFRSEDWLFPPRR